MNELSKAIILATELHGNQTHSYGSPYILHPLRVMQRVGEDQHTQIVAVLHDVFEDTDVSYAYISYNMGQKVADDVSSLSRKAEESYEEYINNIILSNKVVRKVKIADLQDNLNLGLIHPLPQLQQSNLTYRYSKALVSLINLES